MSPLCSPLLGQAIKLFFSTSPKTLSLKFNSAPVHRGQVFNITILGRPQRILLGYIFRYRSFKWFAKVYAARMQWIEAGSNLGSLKAEPELLTTTIMLYPAGMVTCVSLDLMQEQDIFFAKLLCNHQRTSAILITPLTSSSVSGCFADNSLNQTFC